MLPICDRVSRISGVTSPVRNDKSAHLEKLSRVSFGANMVSFVLHRAPFLHGSHLPHFRTMKNLSSISINECSSCAVSVNTNAVWAVGELSVSNRWKSSSSLSPIASISHSVKGFRFVIGYPLDLFLARFMPSLYSGVSIRLSSHVPYTRLFGVIMFN